MWLTVVKVAALTVVVLGVVVLVVVYTRNVRAKGRPIDQSSSHFDQIWSGAMAPTPKPEWVDWDDDEIPGREAGR
jgi:hypothetical protein